VSNTTIQEILDGDMVKRIRQEAKPSAFSTTRPYLFCSIWVKTVPYLIFSFVA